MKRAILTFATLVAFFSLISGVSKAQQEQAAAKPQGPVGWPRESKGYGKTVEAAQKSAEDHALQRVISFLKSQDPPLEAWQPDFAYVKKHHLVKGDGEAGEDFTLVEKEPKVKTWTLQFKEAPNWNEMVQLNARAQRQEIGLARQWTAGYALAALLAVLATGWGYLRIDDWTHGRFTKWLAIGAVTLLGMSGAGWWVMNTLLQ